MASKIQKTAHQSRLLNIENHNEEGEQIMKAVIRLDVPEWQIGQPVHVFFKDSMDKQGVCEVENTSELSNKDFFDWLACSVVLDNSSWEEYPGFYREVICRKLVRLGVLDITKNEYVLKDPKKEE